MSASFRLDGAQGLGRRLRALGEAPRDILRDVGVRSRAEAKLLVPRRTGNLGRTIRIGAHGPDYIEIRAGGEREVGYAAAVEFGSRARVIVPRRRKVLAWGGARTLGGRLRKGAHADHFARRVNHPGARAKPYLIPGIEKALAQVGLGALVERWNRAD